MADGQLLGVDVVVAGLLREATPALGQKESVKAGLAGKLQELGVRAGPREEASHLP